MGTGAQHGVVGKPAYDKLVRELSKHGLKPRQISTLKLEAAGVGGTAKFMLSAEVPVAIAGVSGILTVHVVNQDIPVLLPIGFCQSLGMILDLNKHHIQWTTIGKTSSLHTSHDAPHMSINILEFPPTGWVNPYQEQSVITTDKKRHAKNIPFSEFRSESFIGSRKDTGSEPRSCGLDVGCSGMPPPPAASGAASLGPECTVQHGKADIGSAVGAVEDLHSQVAVGSSQLRSEAGHARGPGEGCVQSDHCSSGPFRPGNGPGDASSGDQRAHGG